MIRIRADLPTRVDDLVRRESIPGTGEIPKELADLIAGNYLYLHARAEAAPIPDLQSIVTGENLSAWRIPLGAAISEGLPGRILEQTAVADIVAERDDAHSQDAVRADWATLAFHPRLAIRQAAQFLRRRNGAPVMPHFVVGSDDRAVFYPSSWPWFCIGRIIVWMGGALLGSATGALVGRNVVLTSSHVVPWVAGILGLSWAMKFVPAYYDGVSTLGSGVYSYVERAKGYSDYAQGDDMAVLKLYQPLGTSLGYFGSKTYNDDWEGGSYWTLISYPDDVAGGERPSCQSGIAVLDDDSDGPGVEFEHNGDTAPGSSGGPLWAWWGDSPRVIGTNSGEEHNWDEDNNVAAGGSALSQLIKWARNNW
jgi:V8-like Glu-specific endopeptidase